MSRLKNVKPLGRKAYGSIPHLPGSRKGAGDRGLFDRQSALLTNQARDRHDHVIVQEKLDGGNVAVAKLGGQILALVRAGYLADTSPFEQHHWFSRWVDKNHSRFDGLLNEGERCVGEWLVVSHGTLYVLPHEPFVVFDIMVGQDRLLSSEVKSRAQAYGFTVPRVLSDGPPRSIEWVLDRLEPSGHGALSEIEGAVWRIERNGVVDFLGKFVRHSKVDGLYLKGCLGNVDDVFNKLQLDSGDAVELSSDYFSH